MRSYTITPELLDAARQQLDRQGNHRIHAEPRLRVFTNGESTYPDQ